MLSTAEIDSVLLKQDYVDRQMPLGLFQSKQRKDGLSSVYQSLAADEKRVIERPKT